MFFLVTCVRASVTRSRGMRCTCSVMLHQRLGLLFGVMALAVLTVVWAAPAPLPSEKGNKSKQKGA